VPVDEQPRDPSDPALSIRPAASREEARVARWMEQAGTHQARAVAWLRQARDPTSGPQTLAQRRELLLRALEHILAARRLLERARQATTDPTLLTLLDRHLARVAAIAESAERLLQELTATEG
jgi:hypothetical protein